MSATPATYDQFVQLARSTVIVADTGDIESIKKYQPTDATTNPSLILAAASDPKYEFLFQQAMDDAKTAGGDILTGTLDRLSVYFGSEITKIVPGVVSTEVDARLSFDTKASIDKAHQLIALYKTRGIEKERILIKLASTWEGIKAAEVLEKEGIHCNLTLLFAQAQAIACANAKVTLISPFVGRILDWYKAANPKEDYSKDGADPGVHSVVNIYKYYKTIGSKTIVMGASFRSKAEVLALAGCDKLTIAPKLLEELKNSTDPVPVKLNKDEYKYDPAQEVILSEPTFRWQLNEDQMATEKLSEGIRNFAKDTVKLEAIITQRLVAKTSANK